MSEHRLDRTVLLLQRDFFPDVTRDVAIDVLEGMCAAVVIDEQSASSASGQVASRAATWVLEAMGIRVNDGRPDFAMALGTAPLPVSGLRITGDGSGATVGLARPWTGELPFGGLLAGVIAGAAAMRPLLARLARRIGQPAPALAPLAGSVTLPPLPTGPVDVGPVDVISAGAITQAAVFALLEVTGLGGRLRVWDDDLAEITNLNRYPLLRLEDLGRFKADVLAATSTGDLTIRVVRERFTGARVVPPLAPRVLIGVDDIPSRWLVQRAAPGWVHVGATSHFEVMSTAHVPGGPCAGCVHPRDDALDGPIPTISFVSLLAGTLQAWSLLAHAHGLSGRNWYCWPLYLTAERGMTSMHPGLSPLCPVHAAAS